MNKTEADYDLQLTADPDVLTHRFEALKLKLAPATFYTPDFLVLRHDGTLELHEVKGFWRDDARVKIKVAAALYPWFRFVVATRAGRAWKLEEVSA